VLVVGAVLAAPPVVTLRDGQTRWFAPGAVRAGDRVACEMPGGRLLGAIPAPQPKAQSGVEEWSGGGGSSGELSVSVRPNGAVQVVCGRGGGTALPDAPRPPYVVGPHGLGLIRGPNTLAVVRKLYGRGTASAGTGSCRVVWSSLGLEATFTNCSGSGVLTEAIATGTRWSSLAGVHVGDSVARMLWDDQAAKRLSGNTWLLGGVGRKHPPRLEAVVGRRVVVVRLVASTR